MRMPLSTLQLCLPYKLPVAQLRFDRQLVVRDELLYLEDLWGQLPPQCDSGVEMALLACCVYSTVIEKLLWPLFSCMDVLKAGASCGSQDLHVSSFQNPAVKKNGKQRGHCVCLGAKARQGYR